MTVNMQIPVTKAIAIIIDLASVNREVGGAVAGSVGGVVGFIMGVK